MTQRITSPVSDTRPTQSLKRDSRPTLSSILREARLKKQLSQQDLAGKLGLGQRQISDLERATIDPRLSTIQNVARVLDLEVMLIPRRLITVVVGLLRAGGDANRPLYSLGDENEDALGDEPRVEIGGTDERGARTARQRRTRTERR